jgi:DNA polymerase-3 subunit delta'
MPFRDAIGHRRIVALLARSVANDSLPPSLVFAGPDIISKRQIATALAQALNCQQPLVPALQSPSPDLQPLVAGSPQYDACGTCAACTRIARGVHPDILVLEPGDSGSIKIDQVRDVVDRAAYRPFEGRKRVVIIEQADALVGAAQNALLKTLEEPPSASVFVLLTARPDMLLATVRSRCIRLWFPAGAAEDVDPGARDAAERVLLHAATTSDPRRRIEAAKELLTTSGGSAASDREQLAGHLLAIGSLLRDVELLAARADTAGLANPDLRGTLDRLTPTYHGDRGIQAYAAVGNALEALNRNAGVKVVADWLVLQL